MMINDVLIFFVLIGCHERRHGQSECIYYLNHLSSLTFITFVCQDKPHVKKLFPVQVRSFAVLLMLSFIRNYLLNTLFTNILSLCLHGRHIQTCGGNDATTLLSKLYLLANMNA